MNPVAKLILLILISLEISLTQNLNLNLFLIIISISYLIIKRTSPKVMIYSLLVPILPAIGVGITQTKYGGGSIIGWIMISRIYAYVLLSVDLVAHTNAFQMTSALAENWHLSSQATFGILAALNLIPAIISQVKTIKAAAAMRNVRLTWCSPTLYFKAILEAIQWADHLSQAMISYGFVSNAPRTHYYQLPLRKRDYVLGLILFAIVQLPMLCPVF